MEIIYVRKIYILLLFELYPGFANTQDSELTDRSYRSFS
jgi:hypothetical protein